MANNKHLYSDLDLRFNATLSTGDVSMKYDTQAVIASIKNLLNTNKYDRPFQPDISSGLNALLFEPLSPPMYFPPSAERLMKYLTYFEVSSKRRLAKPMSL